MRNKHDKEILIAYILNELSETERANVKHHLDACSRCRAIYKDLMNVTGELGKDINRSVKMFDEDAFLIELNQKIDDSHNSRFRWDFIRWFVMGCAIFLCVVIVHNLNQNQNSRTDLVQQIKVGTTSSIFRRSQIKLRLSGALKKQAKLKRRFSQISLVLIRVFRIDQRFVHK